MSTSTSCTATTRTCRSASSSTRSTPRSAPGAIRGPFGGSNWTRERFDAAVAYAEANGKAAPTALSNNFSLAEMVEPIWPGCVAASDAAWKAWLAERGVTNFAWSSQGRGFFSPEGTVDSEEVTRVWHSKTNLARRDRARALAARLGRPPIHVALAYVLAQPFPVVPLIGPRRLVELDDSVAALATALDPEQVRWLESGESGPAEAGPGRPRVRRSAARRR